MLSFNRESISEKCILSLLNFITPHVMMIYVQLPILPTGTQQVL